MQDQDDASGESDTTLMLGEPDGACEDSDVVDVGVAGVEDRSKSVAPSPLPASSALVVAEIAFSQGGSVDAHDAHGSGCVDAAPSPPPLPPSAAETPSSARNRSLSLRTYFNSRGHHQCCPDDCLSRSSEINDGGETWAGYAPPYPWPQDQVTSVDEMLDWASHYTSGLQATLPQGACHILWARMSSGSYSTAFSGIDAPGSVARWHGYRYGTGPVPAVPAICRDMVGIRTPDTNSDL